MAIKVLKNEKEWLEIELDNLTLAELIRNFLWQDDAVTISAWRREHPTKNPVLIIKTKGKTAKKALIDCVERIQKLNQKVLDEFKKTVKK